MPTEEIEIDAGEVQKLASYGCTQEDIADFFGCHRTTISRRFAREFELGKAKVRINVRRWQIRRARKGSDTMLIHLGKHYCGQTDKVDVTTQVKPPVAFETGDDDRNPDLQVPAGPEGVAEE